MELLRRAETVPDKVADPDIGYITEIGPHSFREPVVRRVSTRSSTRNRKEEKRASPRSRRREERESTSSSSESQSPIVNAEKGVANPFPDISEEVRQELEETEEVVVEPTKRVRFSEGTTTIAENRPLQVDEYDILQDIKDQKANATIGQLLHDNANYQKQVREACIRPRRRRIRLPPVAVNFSAIEDYGAPEIAVEIDGCMIQNVPVDGGSGVNLMLETTANDLGYTVFEPTIQVLRMADQSRVVPLGKLTGIPTKIGETTYPLNYVILKIETGRPFPLLLGRPWLYLAEVRVDWGKKEFTFGNPPFPLPWKHEEHMGETSDTDGYTSDWSDQ